MIDYTNPTPLEESLNIEDTFDDGGRAYLYEKLNKLITEKYHPMI